MAELRRGYPAMRTRFEAILVGDDAEHLDAVCTLVFEEVERVAALLSRFDRASEVARLNESPCGQPLRLSVELAEALDECQRWYFLTEHTFDIVARRGSAQRGGWKGVEFDRAERTIVRHDPDAIFDFGGYGKGYALDRALAILQRYDVQNALLHAGTSSVLALGSADDGQPWRATIGWGDAAQTIELLDVALSTSATIDEHHDACDIVDPRTAVPLPGRKSCTALAATAAVAEILSTAGLIWGPAGLPFDAWPPAVRQSVRRLVWYAEEDNAECRVAEWPSPR